MHNACMAVSVTIRNVPDDVRASLADRAAHRGQSLQEFLLRELTSAAQRPDTFEAILRARAGAQAVDAVPTDVILEYLHDGRR